MLKVPENGREGVCVEVGAKGLLAVLRGSFPKAFQTRGEHKVEQAYTKQVPVDFLKIQGLGDLVQGPSKRKMVVKCQETAGKVLL